MIACYFDVSSDKANITDNKCLSIISFNRKITIKIGDSTGLRSLHFNRCSNQWFVVRSRHD